MLSKSWSNIEEEFLDYSQDERDELSKDSTQFLRQIEFIDSDGELSDLGERYLESKFIFEDGDAELILREQLLSLASVREVCQAFYGQETTRKKVEIFLKSKTEMNNETAIGRLLLLLNEVDIIDYSKRTGSVTFTAEDLVEAEGQDSYRVTTRTPYSNIKRLRRCLRECRGSISWVDKHYSKRGLEPLSDEITGDDVSSIRILCGHANMNTSFRDDFKRFVEEMENRGVEAELRVILDNNIYHQIHDRWVLSDTASWNVLPIDSLYQNQEGEIHKTDESVPFDEWWDKAEDIISDWNSIHQHLQSSQ